MFGQRIPTGVDGLGTVPHYLSSGKKKQTNKHASFVVVVLEVVSQSPRSISKLDVGSPDDLAGGGQVDNRINLYFLFVNSAEIQLVEGETYIGFDRCCFGEEIGG